MRVVRRKGISFPQQLFARTHRTCVLARTQRQFRYAMRRVEETQYMHLNKNNFCRSERKNSRDTVALSNLPFCILARKKLDNLAVQKEDAGRK